VPIPLRPTGSRSLLADVGETRLLGVGLLAAGAVLPLSPVGGPPCLLRALTGVPCPLCGMTTGVVASVHGHVATAFAANPAAPLLVLAVVVSWVAWLLGRTPTRLPAVPVRVVVGVLAALELFELARFGKL